MDFSNAFNGSNSMPPDDGLAAFDAAKPMDFSPVPEGTYLTRVLRGERATTKKGDPCYRMRFEIVEGEYAAKTLIRTWTFKGNAASIAKTDLSPFGLTTSAKLLSPFPEAGREYLVRLKVVLQRGNDGREFNDIKRIEIVRVDESPAAAFMLPDESEGGPK